MANLRAGRGLPGLLAGLCLVLVAGCTTTPAHPVGVGGTELPAAGSPTPAECPDSYDLDRWPGTPTREGIFVPQHPTEALLCTYLNASDGRGPYPLNYGYRLATDPTRVATFLDAMSDKPPPADVVRLLIGPPLYYCVVLGYADRPAAVVHFGNGGAEQSGAVRYRYDIRTIYAFWGFPKTGAPIKHLYAPTGTLPSSTG